MPSDPSFDDLMARLRSGDDGAANKVFERFAGKLIALAYHKLDARIRQKLDPEDIVQSVFRSFFGHQKAGDLPGPGSWGNLWSLLVMKTAGKCRAQTRHFHAQRRDVRKEVPLTASNESAIGLEICDREPTPEEAAVLAEMIEELLKEFEGRPGDVLLLLLADYPAAEIRDRIGCTERTVYRTYKNVKEWLDGRAEG
jgi:DNA-directed RNA polymerase specialized sigma24 family protein